MTMFRYACMAVFPIAVVTAFFIDAPLWMKLVVLVWTAIPALVNGHQLQKESRVVSELADHSSNSLPDRMLHAYKEHA